MKLLSLTLLLFFYQCNLKSSDDNKASTTEANFKDDDKIETIRLSNFLSLNCVNSFSLAIDRDTISFIEYSRFDHGISYYSRKYWFDLNYNSDTNRYFFEKIPNVEFLPYLTYLGHKPFFFEQIGNPNIKYDNISNDVADALKKYGVDYRYLKFQKFNDKYFFIDTANTLQISIYFSKSNSIEHLNIEDDLFTITDFFVYDMKDDGQPEIFVFSKNRRPAIEDIGFDVYKIKGIRM